MAGASAFGISLRPIAVGDAAAVSRLRCSPENTRFLGDTDPSESAQARWILEQTGRAGDYYFAVISGLSDRVIGTISAYEIDMTRSRCEWGRWVLEAGSGAAIASAVLILDFVFGVLELDECYSRTVAANAQVVSFHDSMGAARDDSVETVTLKGIEVGLVRHHFDRESWDRARPRLAGLAAAAERFIA